MTRLDPHESAPYGARTKSFLDRWSAATVRWEKTAAPLRNARLVVYHRNLTYLIHWLGMSEAGNLEPKPGLPPTTAHLGELLASLKQNPAKAVVRSAYNDPRAAEWLAERAGIPSVLVPFTVGGTDAAKDLFGLYEDTLARLLAAVK
jgi:zinc/manganese transport system substrate-binding protein